MQQPAWVPRRPSRGMGSLQNPGVQDFQLSQPASASFLPAPSGVREFRQENRASFRFQEQCRQSARAAWVGSILSWVCQTTQVEERA